MTPRSSVRARAREIYGEMAGALSPRDGASEAAPTPDPSPLLARASGGGEKIEAARAEPSLTARVRALYENSAVPVREIARLCGVTERTIYKYVAKGGWTKRYARVAKDTDSVPDVAPAKGAGGRFIRREDKDRPFARSLKATDPAGRDKALAACRKAARLSRAAQAEARKDAKAEALIRAVADNARFLADLRIHRQHYVKGRVPSVLLLRIEELLIGNVEWSMRRLECLIPGLEADAAAGLASGLATKLVTGFAAELTPRRRRGAGRRDRGWSASGR